MKRMPIIAALVLSTVSTATAQQQSVRTRDAASTEQAVQEQDQERIRAQIAADTVAIAGSTPMSFSASDRPASCATRQR